MFINDRLPPLSSLRAFAAVVRRGSVARAAADLGRTPGAVSKQLKTLQTHLGASLFDKHGTGLVATPAGLELAAAVDAALEQLATAYAATAAGVRQPGVHIACSVTFATRWLAPNLAALSRIHPDVRVRLSMTSARELRAQDADLVLAWDWRSYPAAEQSRAIRLAEVRFGPVCAPGYPLREEAPGEHGAAVRITHDHTARSWTLWQELSGVRLRTDEQLSFPHTHLGIEAALAGMGVALVERRLIARELAAGQLVAPFGFTAFPDGLAAIPGLRTPPERIAPVLDWLRDALAADA